MAIRPENSLPLSDALANRNSGLTELNQDARQRQNTQGQANQENNLNNNIDRTLDRARVASNTIQEGQASDRQAVRATELNQSQRLDTLQSSTDETTSAQTVSNLARGVSSLADRADQSQSNLQNRLVRVNIDDSEIGLTSTNQLLESFTNLREILDQNSQGAIEQAYNGSGSLISILV